MYQFGMCEMTPDEMIEKSITYINQTSIPLAHELQIKHYVKANYWVLRAIYEQLKELNPNLPEKGK